VDGSHLGGVRGRVAQREGADLDEERTDEPGDGQRDDLEDCETNARERPPDAQRQRREWLAG